MFGRVKKWDEMRFEGIFKGSYTPLKKNPVQSKGKLSVRRGTKKFFLIKGKR